MQSLFRDGDQHVDAHSNPYLRFHRVLAGTEEGLDTEMLFEPLEKQFHLPSAFVKLCHGEGRDVKIVGQEGESFPRGGIDILYDAQFVGVVPFRVEAREHNDLIATQACAFVHRIGGKATIACVAFCPGDEERGLLGEGVKSAEVQIAAIDDVETAGRKRQDVQDVHVVNRSCCDVDEAGYRAAKV